MIGWGYDYDWLGAILGVKAYSWKSTDLWTIFNVDEKSRIATGQDMPILTSLP